MNERIARQSRFFQPVALSGEAIGPAVLMGSGVPLCYHVRLIFLVIKPFACRV
jgi:hypothetical protein